MDFWEIAMRKSYSIFVLFNMLMSLLVCMTNQSATLVDHLLHLVTPNLSVLRSVQSLGLSDHRCQIMDVDTPVMQPLKYTLSVRSWHSCPWDEVRECLRSAPWHGRLWICSYETLLMICGPTFKGFCLIVWSHLLQ